MKEEKPFYPMRVNKYLAFKNHSTRRGADELISKKRVTINGRLAVLGDKVGEKDVVEVKHDKKPEVRLYFAYNKPKGVVTHSPQKDEKDILASIERQDIFPVGRLDKDSSGLIILTNDGRITDRLLNPEHEHEKEYVVKTAKTLRSNFKEKMEAGVQIEEEMTKPCKVEIINENTFAIRLTEGKRHQIRRMVAALFNEVRDLRRTRIMSIRLGKLSTNSLRAIEGEELKTFLKELGL